MNIGILGSGTVARTLGAKLVDLGHPVMLGTRDPAKLAGFSESTAGKARAGSLSDAAAFGELLFNAINGAGTLAALELAGAQNLNGKILVDISNPLDFSNGMPPSLFVCNSDSLGEQIQRCYPAAKVVKTLNTVTAALMVDPAMVADGDHTLFVSGDDPQAKAQVIELLTGWFGWRDIVDLGDIRTARATEMYLPLWIELYRKFNTALLQLKIVR